MKDIVRYGLTLSLICIIASASLAVMNAITKHRIIEQAQAEEESSLKAVLPEGERFEPVKSQDLIYYKAYNKENKFIGVAFKASGKGYSGPVETMAGMTPDGAITAIKILAQNETPGLGARITEPSFIGQFTKKNMQSLNKIQAISGATISSRAVIDSLKRRAEKIIELIPDMEASSPDGK